MELFLLLLEVADFRSEDPDLWAACRGVEACAWAWAAACWSAWLLACMEAFTRSMAACRAPTALR